MGELSSFPGPDWVLGAGAARCCVVVRWVTKPTRRLHPAADCYRGSGYSVHHRPLHVDDETHYWGCFDAERGDERLKVCERVFDLQGNEFTDVSSWYWHAVLGKSTGPWWAITEVVAAARK